MEHKKDAIPFNSSTTTLRITKNSMTQKLKECDPKSFIKVWIFGILTSSGGLIQGFYIAQFNNFFEFFARGKFDDSLQPKDYNEAQSILNGCLVVGGILCTIFGGFFFKYVSPKFLTVIFIIISSLLGIIQIWASLIMLYVLRVIIGFFVCLYTYLGPIMISEYLPSRFVGPLGAFFYITYTFGVLIAFMITSDISEEYWEVFLNVPVYIDLVRLIIFIWFFYIESPYYVYNSLAKNIKSTKENFKANLKDAFMKDKRVDKLVKAFFKREDYDTHKRFLFRKIDQSLSNQKKSTGIIQKAFSKKYRKIFTIVVMLNIANQVTGIGIIVLYSKQVLINLEFKNVSLLVSMSGK